MNTIIDKQQNTNMFERLHKKYLKKYYPGDLFQHENKDVYILAEVSPNNYSCISLLNGNRFKDPLGSIKEAIEGLEYIREDLKLVVL